MAHEIVDFSELQYVAIKFTSNTKFNTQTN